MMDLQSLRESNGGTLPSYAWPGGYPVLYVMEDGEILCPACANGGNGAEPIFGAPDRSGWTVVAWDIYYEGPPERCAHCNAEIESAYGDSEMEG